MILATSSQSDIKYSINDIQENISIFIYFYSILLLYT